MMWMLFALWLVVAHDLSEYRYMVDVTANLFSLFCSTWRLVLKMFVRFFRINASKSQWHTLLGLMCHYFVFTTFWGYPWSITEQTHGKMESISLTELVENTLVFVISRNFFSRLCINIVTLSWENWFFPLLEIEGLCFVTQQHYKENLDADYKQCLKAEKESRVPVVPFWYVITCKSCIVNFQVVLQGSDDIASRAIELLKETFTSLGPKLRASQVCVLVHH